MIDDTLEKIEKRLEASTNLREENRAALKRLLGELREEVATVEADDADSITGFTEASTREAVKAQTDEDLLEHSIEGLRKSIRKFEVSHPKLTGVVNGICMELAKLGI